MSKGKTGFVQKGFTLLEMLAAIAVVVLLAALLFPAFGKIRGQQKAATCASNLRQIGLLVYQYAGENNGQLPASYDGSAPLTMASLWYCKLADLAGMQRTPWYIGTGSGSERIFLCPSTPERGKQGVSNNDISYGWNYLGLTLRDSDANPYGMATTLASVAQPARTIMVADSNESGNPNFYYVISSRDFRPDCRHSGRANVLFVDGHVELMQRDDLIKEDLYRLKK